jgi:hypothetical protein
VSQRSSQSQQRTCREGNRIQRHTSQSAERAPHLPWDSESDQQEEEASGPCYRYDVRTQEDSQEDSQSCTAGGVRNKFLQLSARTSRQEDVRDDHKEEKGWDLTSQN